MNREIGKTKLWLNPWRNTLITKEFIFLVVFPVFLISLMIPSVNALFGCTTELCTYNGTSDRWNCEYSDCIERPDWVENITEEIVYNITNCSPQDFGDYLANCSELIKDNFNYSLKYVDCLDSKRTAESMLENCENNWNSVLNNYVPKNISDGYKQQAIDTREEMQEEVNMGWYRAGAAALAVAGVIWWVKLRHPKPSRTDILPSKGETEFDTGAIEKYGKVYQLEAQNKELRERLDNIEKERTEKKKRRK